MKNVVIVEQGLNTKEPSGIQRNTKEILYCLDKIVEPGKVDLLVPAYEDTDYSFDNIKVQKVGICLNGLGKIGERIAKYAYKNFYSESGLVNLSGSMLRNAFVETYRISVDKHMKEMQDFIDRVIVPTMTVSMQQEGSQVLEEEVVKIFNQTLKGMIVNCDLGTGKTTVTRSGNPVSLDKNGAPRILASRLTKEQERRIHQLKDYAKTHGDAKITGNITASDNSVIVRMTSEWHDLTKEMSPSQIKNALATNKITQQQFDDINNKIIGMIGAQTSRPDLVEKYCRKMLVKDPHMFFVGKNANDITGITGEIAAVIAISELLVNVDADQIMNWVATNKINNKKLSIDILLEGLGNIQVKNTTLDLATIPLIDVDFAQGNVDTILGRLEQGYNWNTEILRSVIESETFNVPAKAKYKGGGLRVTTIDTQFTPTEPADWSAFVEAYNLMTGIIARTHTFLTAFAPDFLYMSGPSDFKHQLANLDYSLNGFIGTGIHIYLVGGVPHLASSQLKIIQEDLRNLTQARDNAMHFNLQSSFLEKGTNLPYTYVSFRNKIGAKKARITSSYGFTTTT